MFKFLETQKFPVVLLALGVLLILASIFELKDLTKFQISAYVTPHYWATAFGFLFSMVAILLYTFEEITFGWIGFSKIRNLGDGITAKVSNTNINIQFGLLEKMADTTEEGLVVLPANEFFDDECINDKKSALGAYIK